MKLRIRGLESKETLRIEIPGDSSLRQLKQTIAQTIRFPSPFSLRLSLNRTDELSPESSEDSLASLGIAAGDLIFYSIVSDGVPVSVPASSDQETSNSGSAEGKMEIIDEEENKFGKFPESCFVKRLIRVLKEDIGEEGFNHKLIVCAVHSVFLESGFVGLFGEKLRFPDSMDYSTSFRYSVPEILSANQEQSDSVTAIESVVLKVLTLKNYVIVYGSLDNSSSVTYRASLDERQFVPGIASLRENDGEDYDSERTLLELWKTVKDKLALPLMIELCTAAGLPGPACFARLPAELQMRILELVPGIDVARAGCTNKELHYLSLNNELWRQKFVEEFMDSEQVAEGDTTGIHWRSAFAECWLSQRRAADDAAKRRRWAAQRPNHRWQIFGPVWVVPATPAVVPRIGGNFHWPGGFPLFRQRSRPFQPNFNF